MDSLNVIVTAVVIATVVAPLAGDAETMVGLVVSGFCATCLLLHDAIARTDRRTINQTAKRFFITGPFLSYPGWRNPF
jgi:hypothetical protein